MTVDEMLKLPYAQRRIIVVTDRTPAAPSGFEWSKLAKTAARSALSVVGPVVGIAAEVFLEAREKMRAAGEEIMAVPWAETGALRFPVGHPRKNVVYIGHPVEPPVYVPIADFHRFLFEHKVAEAQRLIRCLGAFSVDVIRVEGWDRSLGISAGLDVASASVNAETSASRTVLTSMKLSPVKPPHVPDGLVWLPHEPLWQEVAQARLESGLDAFVIDVRATDDYGVNANLKALIGKTGLEIGGSFVEHRNTVWRLQGMFSQSREAI